MWYRIASNLSTSLPWCFADVLLAKNIHKMSLKKASSRSKSLSLNDDFPGRMSPGSHQQLRHGGTVGGAVVNAGGAGGPSPSGVLNAGGGRFGGLRSRRIEDTTKIFKYIDDNVIGKGVAFLGPFGRRKGECFIVTKLHKQIDGQSDRSG